MKQTRFALMGAAGYIAPRHFAAIAACNGELVAAIDPHDSVGILDRYFPAARFFTEVERFDRYLEKLRRTDKTPVDYVSICSPNYLHDAHARLAMRIKADAICEKPLVLNPWNLDQLAELEQEHGRRVYTVVQLRHHPQIQQLKTQLANESPAKRHEICLTYVTRRGYWYQTSWKGDASKSGGLAMNIGIHFFDLMIWLFGPVQRTIVHLADDNRMAGYLELERAKVKWFLSIDANDLPADVRQQNGFAYRSIMMDEKELDLSENFADLHAEVYREILAGRGFGIDDARPAIDLLYDIRQAPLANIDACAHPLIRS
jgi:UDP-N-acetyl-2-amino-2-deoxyglucuronate dehydrogenase